jgi:hypothetical protein
MFGYALGCRGDHRRQRALVPPHILGPDRFLPEELAGLIIQLPADFLTDALPVLWLGLDQLRLDHLAHDLQVVRGANAAAVGSRVARRGSRRRLLFFGGFHAAFGQAAQEKFQLGGVELFALLAEEPPGQGIELLAENRVLAAGLFQRFLQHGDLLAQLAQFSLE